MRRSTMGMLIAAATLSTRAGAQAVSLGLAATVGSNWQVEAADIGYLRPVHAGPLRSVMLSARAGSFIDEGAIINGSRGFVGGLALGLRTGLARLADVGNETNPATIGADLTLEMGGYAGTNSPLPQGSCWAAVSLLPGVRFSGEGVRYGLVVGPTVFFGSVKPQLHAFLGVRFEFPLAHHSGRP